MGMIMKDGIPYGGIYPIDDAPTQGSNNAVKSGGVHSALSNKVDKVAGKGLSTNDYDNTEKEKNAANAEAIEAIVNKYGAKNLSPIKDISGTQAGLTVTMNSDGSITFHAGTSTNTSNTFIYLPSVRLMAGQYYYSGGLSTSFNDKIVLLNHSYGPVNESDYLFTADGSNNYSMIILIYPQITLSQDVTFYPMIRDARITDPTYVPYAMTNRELTERVVDLTSKVDSGYKGYVGVMSDGVKTYGQLLSDLFTTEVRLLIVNHRLTARIVIGDSLIAPYVGRNLGDNKVFFGNAQWDSGGGATIGGVILDNTSPSDCKWTYTDMNGTTTDLSDLVPGSGVHIRIYY